MRFSAVRAPAIGVGVFVAGFWLGQFLGDWEDLEREAYQLSDIAEKMVNENPDHNEGEPFAMVGVFRRMLPPFTTWAAVRVERGEPMEMYRGVSFRGINHLPAPKDLGSSFWHRAIG
jgi:hypothetical protein